MSRVQKSPPRRAGKKGPMEKARVAHERLSKMLDKFDDFARYNNHDRSRRKRYDKRAISIRQFEDSIKGGT